MIATARLGIWLSLGFVAIAGCGQPAQVDKPNPKPAEKTAQELHGAWWCAEHGVPEGVCGQCDAKLAAEFQKKKDWCDKHNRPDSQCFICHPEHEATFAAQYEAKYGSKPPKPGS